MIIIKSKNTIVRFIFILLVVLLCSYYFQNQNNTQAMIRVSNSKNILVNGKDFFPLGLYYVDYKIPNDLKYDSKINALNDMANVGFNIAHLSNSHIPSDDKKMLDKAAELGIYVIIEGMADVEVMNAFKNKAALIGWNIADDANSRYRPNVILDRHNQVKQVNSNYLTYISMFSLKQEVISRYLHTSDLVGFQSYPISDRPLNSTFNDIKTIVNTSIKDSAAPVIANLQTFKWNEPDSLGNYQREPTFAEIRNMTYQALLGGAKGIIYFSYRHETWFLPEHPELWEGLKSLIPEIKTISPILLYGNLKEINVGIKNILAGIWMNKSQIIAVVINTSYTDTTEVAIQIPANLIQAKPMFKNRASGMFIKGNKLSGVIKPLDVHAYILN